MGAGQEEVVGAVRAETPRTEPPAKTSKPAKPESGRAPRRAASASKRRDPRVEDSTEFDVPSDHVAVSGSTGTAVGTATPAPYEGIPKPSSSTKTRQVLVALGACGPGDEEPLIRRLQRIGAEALPEMQKDFPGLLWFNRHLKHRKLPDGKHVGPLAAAFVAFGADAVPATLQLLLGGTADQRYYASLVAGDLLVGLVEERAQAQLVDALGALLIDADSQVRDAALHALTKVEGQPCLAPLEQRLLREATANGEDPVARVAAIRALGVLRCARATPTFIALLEAPEAAIRDACWRVLRVVCAEDKGPSRKKWSAWWKKHGARPRRVWLLDGLTHRQEIIRKIAHRELERLTGLEVAFDPASGRTERKRVQKAFADWFVATAG